MVAISKAGVKGTGVIQQVGFLATVSQDGVALVVGVKALLMPMVGFKVGVQNIIHILLEYCCKFII